MARRPGSAGEPKGAKLIYLAKKILPEELKDGDQSKNRPVSVTVAHAQLI